jgi:hypothetical protein
MSVVQFNERVEVEAGAVAAMADVDVVVDVVAFFAPAVAPQKFLATIPENDVQSMAYAFDKMTLDDSSNEPASVRVLDDDFGA